MMIRNLVISLGITTLSSFLLYMYFRNRMSDVESKVDIMFQLIQEYEQIFAEIISLNSTCVVLAAFESII